MKIYVKIDTNNVVIGWATSEISGTIEVETNIDVTCTDITYTYKLENSQLVKLTEEEKAEYQQIDICPTKTNQELQEEIENLKTQLETVHERLCTQQEMSATVIASVFGMEALKNE